MMTCQPPRNTPPNYEDPFRNSPTPGRRWDPDQKHVFGIERYYRARSRISRPGQTQHYRGWRLSTNFIDSPCGWIGGGAIVGDSQI